MVQTKASLKSFEQGSIMIVTVPGKNYSGAVTQDGSKKVVSQVKRSTDYLNRNDTTEWWQ